MPTKRSREANVAVEYMRNKPKYSQFVSGGSTALVKAVIGRVLDMLAARRTPRSKLMWLVGVATRDILSTDDPAEAHETEALIKAIEAGISEVLRQRKRYQKHLRDRKRAESSEHPITESGQRRLI